MSKPFDRILKRIKLERPLTSQALEEAKIKVIDADNNMKVIETFNKSKCKAKIRHYVNQGKWVGFEDGNLILFEESNE